MFLSDSTRKERPSLSRLSSVCRPVSGSQPFHFVKVTNSRGGVAPEEVARMIEERRKWLAEARARHLSRIEQLEKGKALMLADLRSLGEKID